MNGKMGVDHGHYSVLSIFFPFADAISFESFPSPYVRPFPLLHRSSFFDPQLLFI